jgi:hypothetical protein
MKPRNQDKKSKPKRPKKIVPVEYIEYNEKDRQEFVLGFHKRKVEKHKLKVQRAKERDLQDKRENKREKRKKLAKVIPMVKQIDSIQEDSFQKDIQETINTETKTTVFISEFDPNDIQL